MCGKMTPPAPSSTRMVAARLLKHGNNTWATPLTSALGVFGSVHIGCYQQVGLGHGRGWDRRFYKRMPPTCLPVLPPIEMLGIPPPVVPPRRTQGPLHGKLGLRADQQGSLEQSGAGCRMYRAHPSGPTHTHTRRPLPHQPGHALFPTLLSAPQAYMYNQVTWALEILGPTVTAHDLGRMHEAIIATSTVYMLFAFFNFLVGLWRKIIQVKQDTEGACVSLRTAKARKSRGG